MLYPAPDWPRLLYASPNSTRTVAPDWPGFPHMPITPSGFRTPHWAPLNPTHTEPTRHPCNLPGSALAIKTPSRDHPILLTSLPPPTLCSAHQSIPMPIKIIKLQVPSYPLIGFGLFTPLQILNSKAQSGSSSGHFQYQSSIAYPQKTKPLHTRMEVNLCDYSSRETTLTPGMLFSIGGRNWIVRAAAKTPKAPTLNFYRNFAFEIGAVPPANFE
ncbi:hypothetical protein PCANC_01880 [Puccinia coronata f. sp. avenae]|uniref:Uncharacterized protein n=1 Tax=Puccinia coronata f. sp. avenae TaxID=200324 RepID=A0A2N5W4I1_9BASI|nr:hypothetical protein PCANC_01880 [Puccinia coronata f. sp. avenae]